MTRVVGYATGFSPSFHEPFRRKEHGQWLSSELGCGEGSMTGRSQLTGILQGELKGVPVVIIRGSHHRQCCT